MKYRVEFAGGSSSRTGWRYSEEGAGCDYMLVAVPDEDGYPVELYAEVPMKTVTDEDGEVKEVIDVRTHEVIDYEEDMWYEELKAEILEQAKAYGYTEENFEFLFE